MQRDEQDARNARVRNKAVIELAEAEAKAWDALSRYKFQMFGYWAGVWVHLNRILGDKQPNPWREVVHLAKASLDAGGETQAQAGQD